METLTEEKLRLFVALPVPRAVKSAIEAAQERFRKLLARASIRWTRSEQMHLTLRFLGSVPSARVAELTHTLTRACAPFHPETLRAQGVGFFPERGRPRVLWVGVNAPGRWLEDLQRTVQASTQEFTREEPEDRFTAHLTLGRVQEISRDGSEAARALAGSMAETCFGEWTASKVELVRSQLSPDGARYSVLSSAELGVIPQ